MHRTAGSCARNGAGIKYQVAESDDEGERDKENVSAGALRSCMVGADDEHRIQVWHFGRSLQEDVR
jgi:hypothetical protein